jgi:Domain of unknown function (DUF4258)
VEVPGYEFSDHAADVMADREIETTWVVRVLTNPERREADRSDPTLTHALGRIATRWAYCAWPTMHPSTRRVVTAYFDRRQRGKT